MDIDTGEAVIHTLRGGKGEPVLMVHGYPQTHLMWHKIAPLLAKNYTVVLTDLRGYGDSSCPEDGIEHEGYSKRKMAQDQVRVMEKLGYEQFYLVGHDRGARVCHQLLLDYPEKAKRAVILDIIPTLDMYERTDMEFAATYYHWFFLIQQGNLPEKLIAGSPSDFVRSFLTKLGDGGSDAFPQDVLDTYVEKFSNAQVIHATCEDYRAGAGIDLLHLKEAQNRMIECPILVLWGSKWLRKNDILRIWRARARHVSGFAVHNCGHFIAEEAPEITLNAIQKFFSVQEPVIDEKSLEKARKFIL